MSSISNEFREVFQRLCGNSNIIDKECSKDVLDLKDSNNDTIFVIKDHHFLKGSRSMICILQDGMTMILYL